MIELSKKEAIKYIISEWDCYEDCREIAVIQGKHSLTLRRLFYEATGIKLPFLCWWKNQDEMIKQYN